MPRYWPFNKYPGTDYETFNWEWLIGLGKKMEKALNDLFSDTGALHQMVEKVLREHPEWVTTVMDGAITKAKLHASLLRIVQNYYATPEMYNGYGDGVTDDSAAMQAAVNSGLPVLLPGEYRITQQINVPDNVNIYGGKINVEGEMSVLSCGNNVTIKNVEFNDLTSIHREQDHSVITTGLDNVIENCTFNDIRLSTCIEISDDNCNIIGNHIDGYDISGIKVIGGVNNINIDRNTILNGTGTRLGYRYPITLSSYTTETISKPATNIRCTNNYISDESPLWEGIDSHGVEQAIIANNIIENTRRGIVLTKPTEASFVYTKHVKVLNNIVKCHSWAFCTATDIDDLEIAGNQFTTEITNHNSNAGDSSCRLTTAEAQYTLKNIDMHDNVINDINGNTFGIYVAGTTENIMIHNNTLSNYVLQALAAIRIVTTNFKGISVKNNTFKNCYYAYKGPAGNVNNEMITFMDPVLIDCVSDVAEVRATNTKKVIMEAALTTVAQPGDVITLKSALYKAVALRCLTASDYDNNTLPTWELLQDGCYFGADTPNAAYRYDGLLWFNTNQNKLYVYGNGTWNFQ